MSPLDAWLPLIGGLIGGIAGYALRNRVRSLADYLDRKGRR